MTAPSTAQDLSPRPSAPLVSIVAPCYNAEKYLESSLRSIFAQDYPNFEVIIVDDGSTDNSVQMLTALQQTYDFQLYTQPNQGVSAALNHGLLHARGVYVATPDLDDIMLPESVRVRAEYLDKHPNVGCVGALIIYMDRDGNDIKQQRIRGLRCLKLDEIISGAIVMGAPVSLYRMAALQKAGFYDPAIKVQDLQITLRVASHGYEVHQLPVHVTRYRRHPQNLSRRYRTLLEADLLALAPYQAHPGYPLGRAVTINKALKYAVKADKKEAWRLLRSIPLRYWNAVTLRRLKSLLLSHRNPR